MLSLTAVHELVTLLTEITLLFAALAGALAGLTTIIVNARKLGQALVNLWRSLRARYKAIVRWIRSWRNRR